MIIVKKIAPAKRTRKSSSADEIRKSGVTVCLLPLCIPARLRDGSCRVSGELRISASRTWRNLPTARGLTPVGSFGLRKSCLPSQDRVVVRHVRLGINGAVLVLDVHAEAELLQIEAAPVDSDLVANSFGLLARVRRVSVIAASPQSQTRSRCSDESSASGDIRDR